MAYDKYNRLQVRIIKSGIGTFGTLFAHVFVVDDFLVPGYSSFVRVGDCLEMEYYRFFSLLSLDIAGDGLGSGRGSLFSSSDSLHDSNFVQYFEMFPIA